MLIDFVENNDIINVKKELYSETNVWIDQFGYSVLHIGLAKGFDEVAFLLIEAGVNINLKDPKGQTALHYCAFYNKPELAKKIITHGGQLDIDDIYGNQPLWTAVFNDYGRNERIDIIKLFIQNGANINHKNKAGRSPLDIVTSRPYQNLFNIFGIEV